VALDYLKSCLKKYYFSFYRFPVSWKKLFVLSINERWSNSIASPWHNIVLYETKKSVPPFTGFLIKDIAVECRIIWHFPERNLIIDIWFIDVFPHQIWHLNYHVFPFNIWHLIYRCVSTPILCDCWWPNKI
jgi:hypothetical protein